MIILFLITFILLFPGIFFKILGFILKRIGEIIYEQAEDSPEDMILFPLFLVLVGTILIIMISGSL